MINVLDKKECSGCTACQQICPTNAITLSPDDDGYMYPRINSKTCINCGLCEKTCPMKNYDLNRELNNSRVLSYAVYNKKQDDRDDSTSGGIFPLLAEYIIERGGVICAARFDDKYHIVHEFFTEKNSIKFFCGSKYAQSDLNGVFRRIKNYLKTKDVLFVGTPCQVSGLKSFLKKEYENLLTCDFICMGINSGEYWENYLKEMWHGKSINSINFKDKRNGWHNWKFCVNYDGGEYLRKGGADPFMHCYLDKMAFRPSCYSCPFRHVKHVSDFTIGDCWGIEVVKPEFDDNKGCSIIILQSNKAINCFNLIKKNLIYLEYPIEYVIKYNPFIVNQPLRHKGYEIFAREYRAHGFLKAVKAADNYVKPNAFRRLQNLINNEIQNLKK